MNARLPGLALLILAVAAGQAAAQSGGGVVAVPEAPPVSSAPDTPLPSRSLPAPDLPAPAVNAPEAMSRPTTPGVGSGNPSTSGAQSAQPRQAKPVWDARNEAVLDVLDKADGAVTRISAPVGSTFTQGKLRIKVSACVVRPADMPPDAAAYFDVASIGASTTDTSSGTTPLFHGWLIRSEPGATVLGDAAVTFRLIGCNTR